MNKCRVCGVELTDENWMTSLKSRGSIICRNCNNAKGREWRAKNRIKFNKYSSDRYFRNPKKSQSITHKSRVKVRIDMIKEYGGKCSDCGITDIDVLDMDHIDNNGSEHRRMGFHGYNLYRFLKKNNWPKDNYQLLCRNCNWKKELKRRRLKSSISDF
jgi:hypothetical protein